MTVGDDVVARPVRARRAAGEASGLVEVGDRLWAWLQPDGSWGLSNAGLVGGGGASLLVDTLFDLRRTHEMLASMRRVAPDAGAIATVVNTHGNGDHCWGNAALPDASVVASRRAAAEMRDMPPPRLALLLRLARAVSGLDPASRVVARAARLLGAAPVADLVDAAPFVERIFGRFVFDGVRLRLPDRTFDGALDLEVDGRLVRLLEVGPAHTQGDVVAHVPDAGVVFAGDVLFSGGHPVVWEGPVSNWVAACDRILALSPRVVVPGHGPLSGPDEVRRLRAYLVDVEREATARFHAGLSAEDAAFDMAVGGAMDAYAAWTEPERLAVNVDAVYRGLDPRRKKPHVVALFGRMARLAAALRR